MSTRITKQQLLREARRVYGDVVEIREGEGGGDQPLITEVILEGWMMPVWVRGRTRAEARRMAMAALRAAGSAK